jgi:hypothetical protein
MEHAKDLIKKETQTQNMQYLLLSHGNNCFGKAPRYYVTGILLFVHI